MARSGHVAAVLFIFSSTACGGATVSQSECETNATCAATSAPPSTGGSNEIDPAATGGGAASEVPRAPAVTPIEGELVAGLTAPQFLAVDDANVYFSTDAGQGTGFGAAIMECPKSGCEGGAAVLSHAQGIVGGIVTDDSEVFFTDSAVGVMACNVAGCGGHARVVARIPNAIAIAIANETLYWTTLSGLVQRCARSCTTPETLATDGGNGSLSGITVSGANVYWTREGLYDGSGFTGAVRTCSIDGPCLPRTLADRQSGTRGVAVEDEAIAWTVDGDTTVRRCTLPTCTDVTAMSLGGQEGIAMSGGRLYWSYASGGWIESARYGSSAAVDFVRDQPATFLAADATNLFWIDTDIPDSRGGTSGTGRIMSRRLAP